MAGRPNGLESERRTREFLRLLGDGCDPLVAAREAQVKTDRVVRLLADPHFRAAVVTLLDQQAA